MFATFSIPLLHVQHFLSPLNTTAGGAGNEREVELALYGLWARFLLVACWACFITDWRRKAAPSALTMGRDNTFLFSAYEPTRSS